MLQFLASVDFDCDGPMTRVYRVDVPSYMQDDESMIFALEHDQVRFGISDPTEWFTVPTRLHDMIRDKLGYGSDKQYCTFNGNIFND